MANLSSLDSFGLLNLLHLLPVGIFLVGTDNRIVWVNNTLCSQIGLEADQLIGQQRTELPGTNIFPISDRVTKQHLNDPGSETIFNFNYITRKLSEQIGSIIEIGCLVKIRPCLDEQIQIGFEPVDEKTGLYNKYGILRKLTLHVSRSRRYFNPLSIILLRILPETNMDHERINHEIAGILKDKLRWVDDVGHWDGSDFLLILPETNEEDANKLARKIKFHLARFKFPGTNKKILTEIAVTDWRKGEDESILLKRAMGHLDSGRCKFTAG
ncbi:MAG: PAS domain-containing protein [Gammaproteobacteria bacterium]